MKLNPVLQKVVYGCLFAGLSLQACQKEDDLFVDSKADSGPETGGSRTEQTLDSIFLYAKQTYLWYDALPSYKDFNPRKYNTYKTELEAFEKEVFDISQLKINSSTGAPYEFVSRTAGYAKYSYLEENDAFEGSAGARMTMVSEGTEFDFGLGLANAGVGGIRIRYVSPGSPAGNGGLVRGDRVLKVNDREVRTDSQSDIDFINNAMWQPSIKLTVQKKDGSVETVTVAQNTYTVNPVFKKTVLNTGGAKVGYLVYDTFTRKSNSEVVLQEAFSQFANAGVTDLVIDLRYNGGGYVHTAEYLCNLIAPSGLNGSIMYTEKYNKLMQEGEADILKNQVLLDENNQPKKNSQGKNLTYADVNFSESKTTYKFAKQGPLDNLRNVVFIVTGRTASASELVINTLKPYMNVAIVGDQTYGKPVGFFGISIDRYKVYFPNFKTINSKGEGDYYDGFTPDIKAIDDVTRDFGDVQEESLATAIAIIENGGAIPNARIVSENARVKNGTDMVVTPIGEKNKFNGMIEERFNLGQ